ncbi:hypothetical protein F4860DRAFT_338366 [Xylaria cubensis]|nr:hypothetical protein F4860DRAFT_338366 [Xylaria cubensis]
MPILRSLPQWPNPQESIGRQIPSSRVKSRMVWWPRGPALDIFEKIIEPEIENILKVVDLGHVDLFIRLYMIGRKPESANPIVFVCCTNSKARDAAEATMRESGLLGGHKGFGLGSAALPLEHPAPVRRLSPNRQGRNMPTESGKSGPANIPSQLSPSAITSLPIHMQLRYSSINSFNMNDSLPFIINAPPSSTESNMSGSSPIVFASSIEPLIGRRVFAPTNVDHPSHSHATAGIVIQVGESYYQLTVGHLFEEHTETSDEEESPMGLDELHFDGQSDDNEQDSDYETEITGRGSASPEEALSSSNSSANEQITRHLINPDWRFPVGCLPHGKSFQAPIDYAIITVSGDCIENLGWKINYIEQVRQYVKDIAEVGHEERSIIVATYSRIIEGVSIPGKVAYRNRHAQFERLVQVELNSEVFEGDSGSTVLDKLTGSFYGHIVMGVPGTKMAYIAQAVDVFRDIEARIGKSLRIVTQEESRITHIRALLLRSHSLRSRDSSESSRSSSGISVWSHSSVASTSRLEAPDISTDFYTAGSLPCDFIGYGGCNQTFALDDVDSWIEHIIFTHLKGKLPEIAVCWFCDDYVFDSRKVDDRRENFKNRMWHIRDHIIYEGLTAHHMRPDHFLNTHLHKYGLIPDDAYQVVRRYAEVPQPDWILPHDGVPPDWEYRNSRGEYVVNDPLKEQRKDRKHRHKSGKSRK